MKAFLSIFKRVRRSPEAASSRNAWSTSPSQGDVPVVEQVDTTGVEIPRLGPFSKIHVSKSNQIVSPSFVIFNKHADVFLLVSTS